MEEKSNVLEFTYKALDIKADVGRLFGKSPMQKLYDHRRAAQHCLNSLIECYSITEVWMQADVVEARAYLEGIESSIRILKGGMGK